MAEISSGKSGVNQIEYLNVLRKMRDVSLSRHSSWRTHAIQERELPTVDDVMLVRQFKDILPVDGRVQVNLSEHVRLECSLVENGQARRISNQEEFQSVSSNGNTALITAMFLMGFVQMIRGTNSGVRLTWVTDEVGRFDAGNLASFMRTLNDHQIDVISASLRVHDQLETPSTITLKRASTIAEIRTLGTTHAFSAFTLGAPDEDAKETPYRWSCDLTRPSGN